MSQEGWNLRHESIYEIGRKIKCWKVIIKMKRDRNWKN